MYKYGDILPSSVWAMVQNAPIQKGQGDLSTSLPRSQTFHTAMSLYILNKCKKFDADVMDRLWGMEEQLLQQKEWIGKKQDSIMIKKNNNIFNVFKYISRKVICLPLTVMRFHISHFLNCRNQCYNLVAKWLTSRAQLYNITEHK